MKKILMIVLFAFISFITLGCTNTNSAISINVLSVERFNDTDTIEFVIQLLDKDDVPTLDTAVSFELDAIDFNDNVFYQGNIGIDKDNFDEDLNLLIRVSVDDTDSTSNTGKLVLKANFSDSTYQVENIDFEFDCSNPFDSIFEWISEDGDLLYDTTFQAYRYNIEYMEGTTEYFLKFEVVSDGSIFITCLEVPVDPDWSYFSVILKFELSDDYIIDSLIEYNTYQRDGSTLYGGRVDSSIFGEDGFPDIEFDVFVFDYLDFVQEDLAFHQNKAHNLAQRAIYTFIEYIEENAGIII